MFQNKISLLALCLIGSLSAGATSDTEYGRFHEYDQQLTTKAYYSAWGCGAVGAVLLGLAKFAPQRARYQVGPSARDTLLLTAVASFGGAAIATYSAYSHWDAYSVK